MSFISTYSAASINGYKSFENVSGVIQTLQPSPTAANLAFGSSLAINSDGSILAISSHPQSVGVNGAGACYIFTGAPLTYAQSQKIVPTTGNVIGFATSTALNSVGDTLAVGSSTQTTPSGPSNGNVYIFTSSAGVFTQQQVLRGSDSQNNDGFGNEIALDASGNYCIVGASTWIVSGSIQQGAAYIFYRSGGVWSQQQKLSPDAANSVQFGTSVAISNDGTYAVVGTPGDDTGGTNKGAVYVFTRSGTTWTQQQKITFASSSIVASYGQEVFINDTNDKIMITPSGGGGNPSLYYTRSGSTWSLQQQIFAGSFNDTLVYTTNRPLTTAVGENQNRANLLSYNGSTWSTLQTLTPFAFGGAINDSGNIILGANELYDSPSTNIGIVYVWTL